MMCFKLNHHVEEESGRPRLLSKVPKGWHYDFQDGETVFNFQGPRGVVLQYTGICVLIRERPKLTSWGDRIFLGGKCVTQTKSLLVSPDQR